MDNELLDRVAIALNSLNARPHRLRGQNFLVSRTVAERIASLDTLADAELPRMEIGAGLASLSSLLAAKPGRLDLLEIEPSFADRLKELFGGREQTYVHNADALGFDYEETYNGVPHVIYGNIPYNITSELLEYLFTQDGSWQTLILMLQKEAAERICRGKGKTNGPLTMMAEYFGEREICFDVPKEAFYPEPAVASAVIRIKRKKGAVADSTFSELFGFIKAAFALRRKTMANSLAAAFPACKKDYWQQLIAAQGLPPAVRAESCTLAELSELFVRHTSR